MTTDASPRRQVGGDHYLNLHIQPWDAMGAWLTEEQFIGYLLGSAIAYLGRFNAGCLNKGGLFDAEKAAHYLEKLIDVLRASTEQQQAAHDG